MKHTSRVCDNIDERIQRLIRVGLLGKALANLLHGTCDLRHVQLQIHVSNRSFHTGRNTYLEVTDDLRQSITAGSNDFLYNVAKVVNQEV